MKHFADAIFQVRLISFEVLDGDGRKLNRTRNAPIKLDLDETVTLGLHVGEVHEKCPAARLAGFRPMWPLWSATGIADRRNYGAR
jgi:hypothetical protein